MRKFFLWCCALTCALFAGSCKYDDADLWESVDDLSGRVAALENAERQAQADIAALQTLTQKMYEQVSVASVLTNEDGSYTIAFTDGAKVTISNGTDGITPPSLSVAEQDGVYYWVLVAPDGTQSYLYDKEGRRIQANGREGRTPQVRIGAESGEWEISTDDGATWTSTGVKAKGEDGDAFFAGVEIADGYVIFRLASGGEEIRLLRALELKLAFRAEGLQEFSFAEQRTLAMEICGVDKFSISKPDGWRVRLTGEGLAVTAPAEENAWAETTGAISVVGFASNGQGAVAEIEVSAGLAMPDTYENLSAKGTANCYVVHTSGGYSLDATVMGNGAAGATFGGVTFADYREKLEPVSAKVIWTTEKSLVRSLSIEQGQLKFVVPEPFCAGNALIAACDADGEVIWSWHIWLTEADLDAAVQTYDNGFVLMDRNLGALAGTPAGEPDVRTFGLYYQWGRKDPFIGPDRVYTTKPTVSATATCRQPVYDGSGNQVDPYVAFPYVSSTGDGTIGSVAYATAHPQTFIKAASSYMDWNDNKGKEIADRNNALWGNPDGAVRKDVLALEWTESGTKLISPTIVTRQEQKGRFFTFTYTNDRGEEVEYTYVSPAKPEYETGSKSIYDPCPVGYRVPSAAIFADYSASTLTLEAQYPELLRTRGDDATWGRWFFLADGTKAWYPANGKIGGANLFQSANYNTGKLWSNHCGNSLSVLTDKEPDNSSLYRGYHYSYSAGVLNAKNAQEIGFGSTTATSTTQLTSAMSYVPALTAGTGLPTPINAAKIGSQQNTGSASRDYANGIRCMKE